MTFGQSIHTCFIKYFTISGRASLSEFWWWQLFLILIGLGLAYINDPTFNNWDTYSPIETIWCIITFIPSFTVWIRRLHDVGRSGWWTLLIFTIIGILVLLFWSVMPSQADNKYGKNPLSADTNI